MAEQSKLQPEEDKQKGMLHLKRLVFLNLVAWLMMIPARPEMVLRIAKGGAVEAAGILGSMTAGASLVEFFATPFLSKYSDVVGRKPCLMFCASVSFAFRLLDFFLAEGGYRSVVAANWLDRLFAGSCFPAFITIVRASFSDLVLGTELAKHAGSIGAYAGLGVMLGPFVGAQVMARTGSPKYTCLLASACSLATMAYISHNYEETLEPEKRKPCVDREAANPFAFVKLLRSGASLRLMSLLLVLQSVPADMHDVKMVTLKTRIGLSSGGIANYMLGSGLSHVVGGILGKKSVEVLGAATHTLVANGLSVVALAIWSIAATPLHVGAALAADALGGARSLCVSADITTEAVHRGMGRGEVAGMLANMGNLVKVVGPVTFAKLFGRFGQRTPFNLALVFLLAAQALHSSSGGGRRPEEAEAKKIA